MKIATTITTNNKIARKKTHSVSRLHICKERAIRIKKTKKYLTNICFERIL